MKSEEPMPEQDHDTHPQGAQPRVVRDLIATLRQGRELAASLRDEDYGARPTQLEASSFGAHYRHHLEHVQMLLAPAVGGLVDYDRRPRDERIEQDRDFALARTDELIAALSQLDDDALDAPLRIAHRTCVDEGPRSAESTLRRELLFLISHAVHHYALMKIIVEFQGCTPCDEFGVMPSTLAHQAEQRASQ